MLKNLAWYLLPVNVLFDVLLIFFEGGGLLPYLRAGWMALLLLMVIVKHEPQTNRYGWLIVFALYCLVNVLFSTDFLRSLNITLKVLIPMLSFVIGFNLFNQRKELEKLNNSVVIVYVVLILNYLISNAFGLGRSVYTGGNDFLLGNLDDNWNLFTYSVLVAPLILFFRKPGQRIWVIILATAVSLMVIISLKRIAIIGLVAGFFIRFLFLPRVLAAFRVLTGSVLLLLLALPLYEDLIRSRLEARSSRFEKGALERESRYLETFYVWDEVISFENPAKSLFGLEGFNSVGNYAHGRFGNRNLHIDYNLIVNTTGLVGFALYFLVFIEIFGNFRRYYRFANLDEETGKQLRSIFFMLFITQFITSFAGQMYHISYRLIVFVYLGAISGTLYHSYFASTNRLQRKFGVN